MNVPNCRQVRTLLMAYLDSELDATTTLGMSEHLSTCGDCRQRLEAEQVVEAGLVEPLRAETMPHQAWARLEQALDDAAGGTSDRRGGQRVTSMSDWVARLSFAAAAALLVITAQLVFDDQGVEPIDVRGPSVAEVGALGVRALGGAFLGDYTQAISGDLSKDDRGWEHLQELLSEKRLAGLGLPQDGKVEIYHPIELLSSRASRVEGHDGVSAIYNCCGSVTTISAVPAGEVSEAVREALPEDGTPTDLLLGDVTVRMLRRGDVVLGISSRHSVGLSDDITH